MQFKLRSLKHTLSCYFHVINLIARFSAGDVTRIYVSLPRWGGHSQVYALQDFFKISLMAMVFFTFLKHFSFLTTIE